MAIQDLAFKEDPESVKKFTDIILDAERTAIKLPIIRIALADKIIAGLPIKEGEIVICDIVSLRNASKFALTVNRVKRMRRSVQVRKKVARPRKTRSI